MADTFVRFVVHRKHWRSNKRSGLFQAMDEVLADPQADHLRPSLRELSTWFNANLRTPFKDPDKQRHADWQIESTAGSISWLKLSAVAHVSRLYVLKSLIEEAGWAVEELRTSRPGRILYEDEHQIVAAPYSETPL